MIRFVNENGKLYISVRDVIAQVYVFSRALGDALPCVFIQIFSVACTD